MRTLAVRTVRANPVRFTATVLAIVVGTGFLAGTLILRDSLGAALEANTQSGLSGVDAAVTGKGLDLSALAGGGTTGSTTAGSPPASDTPSTATAGSAPSTTAAGSASSPRGGRGSGSRRDASGVDLNVPATLLDQVDKTPGVRVAGGVLTSYVNVLDGTGEVAASNAIGARWITESSLSPYRIASGTAPERSGEVAIDQRTAEKAGVSVGQSLKLGTLFGSQTGRVSAIVTYGGAVQSNRNGDVVVNQVDAFNWLNAGKQEFSSIYVGAAQGVDQTQLVSNLQKALGTSYTIETGDKLREDQSASSAEFVGFLGTGLQVFAYIALLVSIFIIYNTFSIIVAQRTREFALLRALGARRSQVTRSVIIEAIVLAVAAALVGVAVGVGLFLALTKLVPQFQDLAGSVTLKVTVGTVLWVVFVGTLVTSISSLWPAFRASRSRPVEALRDVAVDRSAASVVRAVIGLSLEGLGLLLLLGGAAVKSYWLMLPALPIMFLATLIAGPILATGFGWLVDRVPGLRSVTTFRLGVDNVRRNPRRAASTANALVIGVFLVVLVTAGGGAVRDYAVGELAKLSGPDFNIIAIGTSFPAGYIDAVKGQPGVTGVAEAYSQVGTISSQDQPISAVASDQVAVYGFTAERGSLENLPADSIVLPSYLATTYQLGDPVDVELDNGVLHTFTVAAVVKPSASFVQIFVPAETATKLDPALLPSSLAITSEAGKTQQVNDELTHLLRDYSGVIVLPGNFIAEFVKSFFNFLISSVNALLSVAVVIALFGIVNTLILSVSERTHEIGLLRAVGMERRQVRSTVRLESLVVALLGSLIGMGFGLLAAFCLTRPILEDQTGNVAGFSWPIAQMIVILLLGVLLGIVASLIPAWRASRLNIIRAVTVE